MLYLGEVGAEELLRPYRGVVPYHADAVRHLKSGPCVALKIQARRAEYSWSPTVKNERFKTGRGSLSSVEGLPVSNSPALQTNYHGVSLGAPLREQTA